MAMTFTSLLASKGTSGSIANWVNYAKLDLPVVLDEAQSLLFGLLRVREMKDIWTFGTVAGQAKVSLPSRFLDPIGRIRDVKNGIDITQWLDTEVGMLRGYDASPAGDFGNDPFTTTSGSNLVAVELVAHALTQGSTITITDADDVGGLTLNGTFIIDEIVDVDNLVIDANEDATSAATGGGNLAQYTANKLIAASPSKFSIIGEEIQFDCAFVEGSQFRLAYFRSPKLLSASTPSNWLTNRYPKLLRIACMAAAADYMKDSEEYNKHLTALTALVQSTNAENDLYMRGADFGTDTPTPGDYY